MTQTSPELINTAEKLAKARALRDELRDRVDQLTAAALQAQQQHYRACEAYDAAPGALTRAQEALTAAMRASLPVERVQAKVAAAKADIESLRQLRDEAAAEYAQRRLILNGPSEALGHAEREAVNAELLDLTARIGAMAHEMRPLCKRYREIATARQIGLGDSGVLIDESKPRIGAYELLADGSLVPAYRPSARFA